MSSGYRDDEKNYATFEGFSEAYDEEDGYLPLFRYVIDGKPCQKPWIGHDGDPIQPIFALCRDQIMSRGHRLHSMDIHPSQCELALNAMDARLAAEFHLNAVTADGKVVPLRPGIVIEPAQPIGASPPTERQWDVPPHQDPTTSEEFKCDAAELARSHPGLEDP